MAGEYRTETVLAKLAYAIRSGLRIRLTNQPMTNVSPTKGRFITLRSV